MKCLRGESEMIGPKRLSEIKRELRQTLGNDQGIATWLDDQISRSSTKDGRVLTIEEDLVWVHELLREDDSSCHASSRPESPISAGNALICFAIAVRK
jgi:hypothetical protein